MVVRPADLHAIPLFHGITEDHLAKLIGAFEQQDVPAGHVLFEAGSEPKHLLLLIAGEVVLRDSFVDGDPVAIAEPPGAAEPGQASTLHPRFVLHPIAPIGELGAVTGLARNTTALATQPSRILRIETGALRAFFETHGDVAFPFYHNLLNIVSDKVRRDTHRLDETRANLIRTQKAMKRLLELVLESEETPLSKSMAETLEDLIEHNRRIHYLVEPTSTLASWVRLDGGATVAVKEISDERIRIAAAPAPAPAAGAEWSGVLVTPAGEVALSGKVEGADGASLVIKLDLLIAPYAAVIQDYLTRVQMLDFVV